MQEAFRFNNDGAGFMYSDSEKLIIDKGYFGFRKFYKAVRKAEREHPDSVFVLHFRIATHGRTDIYNCHPFYVHKNLGFCHNGIMQVLGNSWLSDSADFVFNYLYRLPHDFISRPEISSIIETIALRSGSKFAFLDNVGKYYIANESTGHWKENVWYSNYGYLPMMSVRVTNQQVNWWYGRGNYSGFTNYEQCYACGQYSKKYTMQNLNSHWYCESCWSILEKEVTILCPFCNEITTVRQDCKCEMCGQVIADEDVEMQLHMT